MAGPARFVSVETPTLLCARRGGAERKSADALSLLKTIP
jgi:hypothetical protein